MLLGCRRVGQINNAFAVKRPAIVNPHYHRFTCIDTRDAHGIAGQRQGFVGSGELVNVIIFRR